MAHRRSRQEKVIDITRWGGSSHTVSALGAGTVAQTYISDGRTETILRIRGELLVFVDAASAPGKMVRVGVGALVVQVGSGSTVIQSPLSDPDAPWLFYEVMTVGYEEMVTDVIDVPGLTSVRKTIDNKAMRVLRPGREVQLVFENQTLHTATNVNISWQNRTLLGSH